MTTSKGIEFIHSAIADACSPSGFRKEGSTWYCRERDAILVISPQKSQYGAQFFVNVGVYFTVFGTKPKPREEECHLRGRLTSLIDKEDKRAVERALDFEDTSIDGSVRKEIVTGALRDRAVPLLKACSTLMGVTEQRQAGALSGVLLNYQILEALDSK
jgi:hypothetical protein